MLRLTKKLALAVEAVVDIGCHGGNEPVQSQDIAMRLGLPKRYLEQVMQQLVRAGILKGVRGPRGGYRLAREQRRISIGDVFRVIRKNEIEEETSLGSESELGSRVMAPFWMQLEEDFVRRLDDTTVEELCRTAADKGVRFQREAAPDFAI
ncbi:transcriptional regulator, BadM/Rrf2 family [Arboricoccus pini]|uniref:Transcriptional regulator, BadM/Rrf2 family n=1 Tax=Arboricoccus pini TaxID=1963835 RepID=A0A212QSL8_9PROT|nr:Rrf2 family transcriptional regulator [Arboricoccus pini]SNB62504.1 transcriptional regulator, BadM/Rrf2 family [Arboricoccus pini]